ncbi:MAG: M48 family metallopeptidase, partial [Candidatus Latescibacteria bacterium]|nr:M48 family metallopeptidase [Candidatus Latescibacterota bacterium]
MTVKSITLDLEGVGPVLFEASRRARRLVISVRPFHGVRVAVPHGVSLDRAAAFAHRQAGWIRKHIARMKSVERKTLARRESEPAVDREEARAILTTRLDELARRHGFAYNRVFIRKQKTRWGSCSARNNINLNMRLCALPRELMDYVLLHELLHTKIRNHGPRFWDELDSLM